MTNIDLAKYKSDHSRSLEWSKPFYAERPPAFSPAAAAQENHGQNSMLWKFVSQWIPWQYTNFIDESLSFHETAYLGDWSPISKFTIKGVDAHKFLTAHCANNLLAFNPRQLKHAILTNSDGKIAGEGILFQANKDEYQFSGGGNYWLHEMFQQGAWDAECRINTADYFVFVVQGPASLYVMEAATGERFRDLKFNQTRMTSIRGHSVRILRCGVTGELGYEIHGSPDVGNDVWVAIHEAGQEYGLRLLGGRSQLISHVEGCYPTYGRDYWPATNGVGKSKSHHLDLVGGSYEWSDISELYRSPFELGWDREVSLDTHDFVGRDALAAEKGRGGPARRLVGLIWNSEDVIDIFSSLYREGTRYQQMDMPRMVWRHAVDPDKVLKNGKAVGCSTSQIYSSFLRKTISLCVIEREFAAPGTELILVWGNKGSPQREIRVTVTTVPFKPDKRRTDVSEL